MNARNVRGVALPETALVIGLSMLVILGAAQMTLIGYSQVAADGAAFTAAHARAANPSAAANGSTAAISVFPQFIASNFTTPSPGTANISQSQVTKSVGGFTLLPGGRATFNVRGADVEYAPAQTSATPAPFTFSVTATLYNYCDPTGNCPVPATPSNVSIWLAQSPGSGNGNGVNGIFSEWQCHQKYYASVNWPGTRPANYPAIQGGNLDPKNHGSAEDNIYSWDGGSHHCS
jgi:hypothetical protein